MECLVYRDDTVVVGQNTLSRQEQRHFVTHFELLADVEHIHHFVTTP